MICSPKEKNIAGQKFGRLTAMSRNWDDARYNYWLFKCECEKIVSVRKTACTTGRQISCGCARDESAVKNISKHHRDKGHDTHGFSCHELYDTWRKMKDRCYNESYHAYNDYGGRGIGVCDRWRYNFDSFIEDMGERPEGMTLDRIDNNKGYQPDNCRWATMREQCNNRRDNVLITAQGVTYSSISEASRHTGKTHFEVNRDYR